MTDSDRLAVISHLVFFELRLVPAEMLPYTHISYRLLNMTKDTEFPTQQGANMHEAWQINSSSGEGVNGRKGLSLVSLLIY